MRHDVSCECYLEMRRSSVDVKRAAFSRPIPTDLGADRCVRLLTVVLLDTTASVIYMTITQGRQYSRINVRALHCVRKRLNRPWIGPPVPQYAKACVEHREASVRSVRLRPSGSKKQ